MTSDSQVRSSFLMLAQMPTLPDDSIQRAIDAHTSEPLPLNRSSASTQPVCQLFREGHAGNHTRLNGDLPTSHCHNRQYDKDHTKIWCVAYYKIPPSFTWGAVHMLSQTAVTHFAQHHIPFQSNAGISQIVCGSQICRSTDAAASVVGTQAVHCEDMV